MNRLKEFFEQAPDPESVQDFYRIETRFDTFIVSQKTAMSIERRIDQTPSPRWIVFRDLSSARHRILCAHLCSISESTRSQRAAQRAFGRARDKEYKDDRSWDAE